MSPYVWGKDQQQQRDVGTIGLKTVVAELGSHPVAPHVVTRLAPKLTAHVTAHLAGGGGNDSVGSNPGGGGGDISGDCLDILNAMVSGYGSLMAAHHEPLKTALLAYLAESGKQGTRKRAVTCLGALSASMSDALLAGDTRSHTLPSGSSVSVLTLFVECFIFPTRTHDHRAN